MFQIGGIPNYIGQMFPFFNTGNNFFAGASMPVFSMPFFSPQPIGGSIFGHSFMSSLPTLNFSAMPQMLPPMPSFKPITYTSSASTVTSSSASVSNGTSTQSSAAISDTSSELKPGLFKGRLAGKEGLVCSISKKYGVSPALVASIIGLESGYGASSLASHNNFMGYRAAGDLGKNDNGFGYFSTIEKGLDAAIKNLSRYTRFSDVSAVDFNNLDSIGRHYCEGGVWAGRVKAVYNDVVKKYVA